MVVSPLTGGGGGCLRRFMSALLLLLSFAAARAAVAMVSRLPGCRLGCPLYGTASARVTADRLGTNECVLALPRVVRSTVGNAEQTVQKLVPLCYLERYATPRKCKACLAAVGASPRQA